MTALLAVLFLGCDSSSSEPEPQALFTVEVVGQTFKVKAHGEAAIAALEARRQSGQEGVIHGRLVRGDGGFNGPWGWHLDPASVTAPDAAIELCDGEPSFVQQELDYYLESVKFYCPWGAKVVARDS
jgi:hypothetical protein